MRNKLRKKLVLAIQSAHPAEIADYFQEAVASMDRLNNGVEPLLAATEDLLNGLSNKQAAAKTCDANDVFEEFRTRLSQVWTESLLATLKAQPASQGGPGS